jgi:predicted  nucleic acid-binding Zn-ribbon protein
MDNENRFTTWKDFAYYVMDRLDDIHEKYETIEKQQKEDHDKLVMIMTILKIAAAIIVALFGLFEYSIHTS